MSTLEGTPAVFPLRTAVEARDLAGVADAFAPDAVLRSPLTGRFTFNGREQIVAVVEVLLDVCEDFHYTDELFSGDGGFLVAHARVDGKDLEIVDHIRLDESGKIQEFTAFFRPMPAMPVALRLMGAGLTRPKSRIRAAVISVLTRPLELMARVGDVIGARLVRPVL
jgi:hypothetical protein